MLERILNRAPATDGKQRKPSVRGCAVGVLLAFPFLIVGCLVLGLLFAPDYWVVPALLIPDRLGVLKRMTEDQVTTFAITGSVPDFNMPQSGTYILLARNSWPGQPVLKSKATGKRIALYQTNAINLYGVSNLDGVPLGQFTVDKPETIEISMWNMQWEKSYAFALAPDFAGKNSTAIALSFILHVASIVSVIGVLYYGLNKNKIRLERAAQIEKRDKLEKWIKDKN